MKQGRSSRPAATELRAFAASSPTITPVSRARAMETYAALPMSFEANNGQSDPRVKFLARAPGYMLYLTQEEADLSLTEAGPDKARLFHGRRAAHANAVVRLKFAGAHAPSAIAGGDLLQSKSNYFIGNDPKQWRTNVPNYGEVRYSGLYPGVDAVFHARAERLEYDFIVQPGADPGKIALQVRGGRGLHKNKNGDVVLRAGSAGDAIVLKRPEVYQDAGGHGRESLPN